jgi:hypothetical protein
VSAPPARRPFGDTGLTVPALGFPAHPRRGPFASRGFRDTVVVGGRAAAEDCEAVAFAEH